MITNVNQTMDESAGGNCQSVACAEPVSRPKPAAWRVEAKRRALTPASTGGDLLTAGERLGVNHGTGTADHDRIQ